MTTRSSRSKDTSLSVCCVDSRALIRIPADDPYKDPAKINRLREQKKDGYKEVSDLPFKPGAPIPKKYFTMTIYCF